MTTPKDYRPSDRAIRRESFLRWWAWSTAWGDCDPALWALQYLHARYEHNDEERLWCAWLYGHTYRLPTSWVLKQEFPDMELATDSRVTEWNTQNYKRLRYQTDTKYNKGHLPVMLASYRKWVEARGGSQRAAFTAMEGDNEVQTFRNLWNAITANSADGGMHKFGRYSTWFYLQTLKHTAQVPLEADQLFLADKSGSKSHRTGLLYALGREAEKDDAFTPAQSETLEQEASEMRAEAHSRWPSLAARMDYFGMETCLCSYKKVWRVKEGRYLGYYLDRQAEEIRAAQSDGWTGVDWNVLWQARQELLDPRLGGREARIQQERFPNFLEEGVPRRQNWSFRDDPDTEAGAAAEARSWLTDLLGLS